MTARGDHSEAVGFYSSGIELAGELRLPAGAAPPPIVVLCQGFGGIKRFYMPAIAGELAARGVASFVFDYRGFGESGGERGRLFPMEQVGDVRAAVAYIRAREDVDTSRIVLLGTSFGASIAIEAASREPAVSAVIGAIGVADGRSWLRDLRRYWEWCAFLDRLDADRLARTRTGRSEQVDIGEVLIRDPESEAVAEELGRRFPDRTTRLSLESAEAILEFRPIDRIELIAPRPVLLIGISSDTLTPLDQTLALFDRASDPKQLLVLDGLHHHAIYDPPHLEPFVESVVSFISGETAPAPRTPDRRPR